MKTIKSLLTFVLVSVFGSSAFAQSSMLATLSHEGEISTFYGALALRDAVNAAADGDVITLSSGTFVSVDITKGLTIRGAGMYFDTENQSEPTIITGDFKINMAEGVTHKLTMEGIYQNNTVYYSGKLTGATFLKCRFKKFSGIGGYQMVNGTFIHCRVTEQLFLGDESSALCVNCVIMEPSMSSLTTSNFEMTNCVLWKRFWYDFRSSSLKNCILETTSDSQLNGSNTAFNCISTYDYDDFFGYIPNYTNTPSTGYENVFKHHQGYVFADDELFELTDEAKTTYLGADGTEVGIYGGNMPYSSTTSNPKITKLNVASKSTADGKLSVDITVSGAE